MGVYIVGNKHNISYTIGTHLPSNFSTNFDGSTDTQIDKKMDSVAHLKVTLNTTKLAHNIVFDSDSDTRY